MKNILNKKSNTAFMTTVFPGCMSFFNNFMESLVLQTDIDFDLLVINDGVDNLIEYIEKYPKINYIQILSSNSIVENRKKGLETAINLNYEYLIFGDSDDYFDSNRIAVSKYYLKEFDIVVNDLSLFDKEHGIYKEKCFSKRLKNNSKVDFKFIEDKNIFGLTNTAIKVSIIGNIYFCENLIALDWYFFSQLLRHENTAVFTNTTLTYYRQHKKNTVGLGDNSVKSIKNAIRVKKIHYQCMVKSETYFEKHLLTTNSLEEKIHKFDFEISEKISDDLLWWENTLLCN